MTRDRVCVPAIALSRQDFEQNDQSDQLDTTQLIGTGGKVVVVDGGAGVGERVVDIGVGATTPLTRS